MNGRALFLRRSRPFRYCTGMCSLCPEGARVAASRSGSAARARPLTGGAQVLAVEADVLEDAAATIVSGLATVGEQACKQEFRQTGHFTSLGNSEMKLPQFPVDGGCQCGAVRYRLLAAPLGIYACHCKDCQ
eukprot:gene58580-78143_t